MFLVDKIYFDYIIFEDIIVIYKSLYYLYFLFLYNKNIFE